MVEHNDSQKDIFKLIIENKKIIRITDLPYSDETAAREEANGEKSYTHFGYKWD